jgi:hypothetical protein
LPAARSRLRLSVTGLFRLSKKITWVFSPSAGYHTAPQTRFRASPPRTDRAQHGNQTASHSILHRNCETSGTAISPVRATRDNRHLTECRAPLSLCPTWGSIRVIQRRHSWDRRRSCCIDCGPWALANLGGGARTATAQTVFSVEVLSSRPDLLTGGDALGADV